MTLHLRNGVVTTDTDYGLALLDQDSGQYYSLNPTGALVLRTMLDGGAPEQAVDDITQQYAIDADTARQDVEEVLALLRSAGLIVEEPDPSPAQHPRRGRRRTP